MIWRNQAKAMTLAEVVAADLATTGLHFRPGHAPNGNGQLPVFDAAGDCVAFVVATLGLPVVDDGGGPQIRTRPEDRREVCATCDGRGEVGGWVGGVASIDGGGGYESEPCPDCTTAPGESWSEASLFG